MYSRSSKSSMPRTSSKSRTTGSGTPSSRSGPRKVGTPSSSSSSSSSSTSRSKASTPSSSGASSSSSAAAAGAGGSSRSPAARSKSELARFTLDDVSLGTTLGTGTFGRVRLAFHKPTKRYCALKILKKSEIIRLKQVDHIKSEIVVLSLVRHPFIVNMLGFMHNEKRLYMLLEYVPGGELFSHLRAQRRFPADTAKFYSAEILLAFQHLHGYNIVYRDLKPENLLITTTGHIKITDFGFAKIVADKTWTLCGTPEYLAPEIIQSKGHGKSVDWWALGILIYEMIAGYPPFYDESAFRIYQKILSGAITFNRQFDVKVKDLIRKLLTADTTKRLGCMRGGAEDIKNHKWYHRLNWDGLFKLAVAAPFIPTVTSEDDTSNFDEYPNSTEDTAGEISAKDKARFAEFDSF